MVKEYPMCPECGYPLSLTMEIESETRQMMVDLFCEGPGDDEYHLQIQTGLRARTSRVLKLTYFWAISADVQPKNLNNLYVSKLYSTTSWVARSARARDEYGVYAKIKS